MKSIAYWINIARRSESSEVEISKEWESWVAEPCKEHQLAPRHARAILEIFGHFADQGISVADILSDVVSAVENKYNKPGGRDTLLPMSGKGLMSPGKEGQAYIGAVKKDLLECERKMQDRLDKEESNCGDDQFIRDNYVEGSGITPPKDLVFFGKEAIDRIEKEKAQEEFNCSEDYFESDFSNAVSGNSCFICKVCGWKLLLNGFAYSEAGVRPEVGVRMRDHVYLKHR